MGPASNVVGWSRKVSRNATKAPTARTVTIREASRPLVVRL